MGYARYCCLCSWSVEATVHIFFRERELEFLGVNYSYAWIALATPWHEFIEHVRPVAARDGVTIINCGLGGHGYG